MKLNRNIFNLANKTFCYYQKGLLQKNKGEIEISFKSKVKISEDSYLFKFELPSDDYLGCPVGQCVSTKMMVKIFDSNVSKIEEVFHKYTPISSVNEKGYCDFLIKIYKPSIEHPIGGRLTQTIDKLSFGEKIIINGPLGKCIYLGNGKFNIEGNIRQFKNVSMLCGGTGIAPFYQILQSESLNSLKKDKKEKENVKFKLFYSNKSENDILLYTKIKEFEKNIDLKTIFLINSISKTNSELLKDNSIVEGIFNKENLQKYTHEPDNDTLILTCGRKKLCVDVFEKNLIEFGHKKDNIFRF